MDVREVKFSCPLDCSHSCGMIAVVNEGKVTAIRGDRNHPVTGGLICRKGKQHLTRLYHEDRLKSPKRKMHGKWFDITYEEALDEIAEKFLSIRQEYGSQAVLHYTDFGYGGLSKNVDKIFFDCYGGVSVHRGGLCHQAGEQAQIYDMGANCGHDSRDMVNAHSIWLWGKNPADTGIHFARDLNAARRKGVRVFLIDPIRTNTAKISDEYIQIKPGTDGALALGMAKIIIDEELINHEFIERYTLGYPEFAASLKQYCPEAIESITGIDRCKIREMAQAYAGSKPAAIYLGYGIQRYGNGGNTVRAIDALGALTGNIGITGGGVSYSYNPIGSLIGAKKLDEKGAASAERSYVKAKFADFVMQAEYPPIKMMLVSKANPVVQLPDINRTIQAFKRIDFKVTIDLFMTDTARHSDLVLPAASVLEEDDFMAAASYLNYSRKAVEPVEGIMGEYELFRKLADRMGLKDYPRDIDGYFRKELQPLIEQYDVDYESLKQKGFVLAQRIPWQDRTFKTPSKKFEFYSARAAAEAISPLPVYSPVKCGNELYPLRLLTPHHKNSMHSQAFAFSADRPTAYINQNTLDKYTNKSSKKTAAISSEQGHIEAVLAVRDNIPDDTIVIYEGWWLHSGSVNLLVPDYLSDMGELAAYFECFCRID